MADDFNIYKRCGTCKGTGVIQINDEMYDAGPPTTVPCSACGGEGKIFWGVMLEQEEE
jgi:DnaJ-class molecular chaperone